MPISYLGRTVAATAVVAGSFAILGAPAAAQECYPPTPGCGTTTTTTGGGAVLGAGLTLPDTSLVGCQSITPTITGFKPGTSGIITIASVASVEQQIGSFTVPVSGTATTLAFLPANLSVGPHTLFARGTLPNGTAGSTSQAVTVAAGCRGVGGTGTGGTGTGGGARGNLARTGVYVIPASLLGRGLVAGGAAMKRASKRGKAGKPA